MNEIGSLRAGVASVVVSPKNAEGLIDGFYRPRPEGKHKSPTKRLINHKNSTTVHK